MNYRHLAGALALSAAIATAACGDDPPPTQPTPAPTPAPPPPANPVLTAPRPTSRARTISCRRCGRRCVVLNATADQAGSRSYEFQVSDDPDFAPASASSVAPPLPARRRPERHSPKVPTARRTFTVAADLQPTTRFYWRARARQGTVDGPWSAATTFRTKSTATTVPASSTIR